MAEHANITSASISRRVLALGGGAFAAAGITAGTVAATSEFAAHPDARLIRTCADFIACERAREVIYGDGPEGIADDDEALLASQPLNARQDQLLDDMQRLQATTAAGVLARAQALAEHGGDFSFSFDYPDTVAGRLLGYLMRDAALVGRGAGA